MHFSPILKHPRIKYLFLTLTVISLLLVSIKSFLIFKEQSYGPFQSIDKYNEAQAIFNACNEKTLVTFDVDDTLITAADVMANFDFPLLFKIRAAFRYPELLLNKSKLEYIQSLIFRQAERFVFDPDIVNIIQQTQCHGSKVVALTSMESGSYGCIESMPEWRANMLSNFGINFNKEFQDTSFTSLPLYREQYPCLYKGVLCANQQKKGTVLGAFLDYYNLKPERIISFDDQTCALNSIAKACAQRKINFTGYQILGAKKLRRQWDMDRALVQLDSLMQHSEWLRDKDADYSIKVKAATLDALPLIPRAVLFGNPEKSNVSISPNGQMLAYLAPSNGALNIWVKSVGKNDDRPVTNSKQGTHEFYWSKNNQHILFLQDENANERWHIYKVDLKSLKITDLTPIDDACAYILNMNKNHPDKILITINENGRTGSDVYLLDIITGELKLVAKNPGDIDVWCADSNLNVKAAVSANSDGSTNLLIRDNIDSKWIKKELWALDDSLVGSVPPKGSRPIGFSLHGTYIYLIESKDANTQQLVSMNIATGEKEILAKNEIYDIDSVILNNDSNQPDLVCFQQDRKVWEVLNTDLTKDVAVIKSIDNGDLVSIDRSSDNMKWLLCFSHDNKPLAYYLYDRATKRAEFLFYNNQALTNYTLAKTKPISFKSRDGLTIYGYLTIPPIKQEKNLPLVLFVHGGPWDRDVWGYDNLNAQSQLFANRGYACLQINFRGSSGYGKQFLNAGNKEWAGKMHSDLIDAVSWAIKNGIANKNKIAIYGVSYGGYAALVGATFTPDVFCCAVDLWGPSNLVTLVRSIVEFRPMGRTKWYNRVGNPDTESDFLKSRSPFFKVENIKIPVFIAQGTNDVRVKQEESDQMVAAMKTKGLEHEYMIFPGEGHGLTRPENRFKAAVAIEKFLAKHLDGRVEG